MEIPKNLKDEIWEYCRVNNISNIDEFKLKLIQQGFTIEKFGATPTPKEKIVEKVIEVEKIVEKVVEKIIEVPVETIVEKEVFITDNEEIKKLADTVSSLENQLSTTRVSYKKDIEVYHEQVVKLNEELTDVKEELDKEKKKNKKDFYGEDNGN